jgi:hypothetical protein
MPAMTSHVFQNPNEIIRDTPWGDIPAWKASTLATGTMGAYDAYMKQARADSALVHDTINAREDAVTQREQAITAREAFIHDAVAKVHALLNRCDSVIRAEEERRSQEQQQQEEEESEPPPGSNDEGALEIHPAKTAELDDQGFLPDPAMPSPQQPGEPSEIPDGDEDEGEVLQRAPLPNAIPGEPFIPPTEVEDD